MKVDKKKKNNAHLEGWTSMSSTPPADKFKQAGAERITDLEPELERNGGRRKAG